MSSAMATQEEKIIFGLLGAMTAVMVGLALFIEPQTPSERSPASVDDAKPDSLYFYYID